MVDADVAQVIRRYTANGEIDNERGRVVLGALADLPLRRYPHDFHLPRIPDLRNKLEAAACIARADVVPTHVMFLWRDE